MYTHSHTETQILFYLWGGEVHTFQSHRSFVLPFNVQIFILFCVIILLNTLHSQYFSMYLKCILEWQLLSSLLFHINNLDPKSCDILSSWSAYCPSIPPPLYIGKVTIEEILQWPTTGLQANRHWIMWIVGQCMHLHVCTQPHSRECRCSCLQLHSHLCCHECCGHSCAHIHFFLPQNHPPFPPPHSAPPTRKVWGTLLSNLQDAPRNTEFDYT